MGIAPCINQLRIDPDAIAGASCRALQNMRYAQCQSDFTQIAHATLELLHRGAANHFKVCDLCQTRENVVVYSGCEVLVLFVVAQIFEWKNGNAFFGDVAGCGGGGLQRSQTCVAGIGTSDSLRRQIGYAGKDERERKSQHQHNYDQADRPVWNIDEWENLRCDLN